MSLPPGFLEELRTRLSITQVVGRKVMWDARKSNQGKGDMWAPCPFHQEKTASFHVDDRKGYYYCFGCHAKGDAIKFVRETENLGFMEAVELLAGEAGMPMPERDPRAQEQADRRTTLIAVMEQAIQHFRLMLKTAAGAQARSYLHRRGLDEAALERWEIGFAPPGWDGLREALSAKGVSIEALLDCGLVKASDKGRAPYDVFRNRIMFPIRDGRGRAIAFGGRAMDPGDNAKYLNSPETVLFDKSRNLYNQSPARVGAGKGQPLIVAEGYMDVIALAEAGFTAAVAPLGTAVTEHQLHLLWRMADEPLIALDGDKAGLRAAYRVIDIALPLLEAGKGLRFAIMPDGQDPDDLLRAKGPEAVRKVLEAAIPMVQLLWRQETEGKVFDSPERKAALDKTLRARLARIQDPGLRRHYGDEIKDLRYHLFRPPRPQRGPFRDWRAPPPPSASVRGSALVAADDSDRERMREAVVLCAVLSAPEVAEEFEDQLDRLPCRDADLRALRDAILRSLGRDIAMRVAVEEAIGVETLETLLAARHVSVVPAIRRPGDADLVRLTVAEELAKLEAQRGWEAEVSEAAEDLDTRTDEALTWRLAQAAEARQSAGRPGDESDAEFEIGPNGAQMDRRERDAFHALLRTIGAEKPT